MKKRYKIYLLLMFLVLLLLFSDSLDYLLINLNPNLNYSVPIKAIYQNMEKENNSLKKIVDLEDSSFNFIVTKIKYRDIYDFKNTFTIYKGLKQGIKENSPVISEDGLVGIIKKVKDDSSEVELITNKNSNISVRINDVYGILKYQDNKLIVSNITNYENAKVGDEIYTSGIGNLPGGIFVGTVEDISLSNLEIEKIIYVESKVDFNNLIYLLVVGEK